MSDERKKLLDLLFWERERRFDKIVCWDGTAGPMEMEEFLRDLSDEDFWMVEQLLDRLGLDL